MPLPLTLCDDNHPAIAFLGDCPLCYRGEGGPKRQFSKTVSRIAFVPQLEEALKERYGNGQAE